MSERYGQFPFLTWLEYYSNDSGRSGSPATGFFQSTSFDTASKEIWNEWLHGPSGGLSATLGISIDISGRTISGLGTAGIHVSFKIDGQPNSQLYSQGSGFFRPLGRYGNSNTYKYSKTLSRPLEIESSELSATLGVSFSLTHSEAFLLSATIAVSIDASATTNFSPYKIHSCFYSCSFEKIHQISYNLGDLPARLHEVLWTSVATRAHTVSYEVTLASSITSSSRYHEVLYTVIGVDSLSSAFVLHEVTYEGSGVSPLVLDQRLHEVLYSVIGADSISSATQYHEVVYEGSGVSPLVADQRLHEVSYAAVGADPVSSASAFHQVTYSVFVPPRNLHEVFYKVVVLDQRLHTSGWKVDTEQRRLHEVRYHVVDTTPIIDAGTISVGDGGLNAYDFLEITITADEDSPYWQCEMTLKDAKDYVKFPRDAPFVIRLFDVDFNFIVDRRTLNRTIDDSGNYSETCTISGLSPLVARSRPRAARLTQTWTTPQLASSVVEDLIGSVTWNLVDWNIPAYRLAAERADPFTIAQQVVAAPGGLIESQPDGSVICRHRWPVSIAALATAVVDQSLDETVIYAASEAPTQDELIDRVRIHDGEAAFQDRLEYVPNKLGTGTDPRNGILYAFISPWRDGLRIVTTRPSVISIGAASEGTRTIGDSNEDYPAEIITFAERTGSTQYPIMTLTALDWLDEDLGAVVSVPYATTLDAGDGAYGGYSLAKVQYVTRYLAVPVRCTETVEEIEAQFLLLENQDG